MPAFSSASSNTWPGRTDERPAGQVLLVAGLLADEHDRRVERAFAEHRLRRVLVEVAAGAAARFLHQRIPRRAQVAARLDAALGLERVLQAGLGGCSVDHLQLPAIARSRSSG